MKIEPIGLEPTITENIAEAKGIWIKEERLKNRPVSILIFLSLPKLGILSARIVEDRGSLALTIKSKSKETSLLIKENLSLLTKELNRLGFLATCSAHYSEDI